MMKYEAEFDKHFRHSPLATAVCSLGDGCFYFNKAMEDLFECSSEDLKIKHFNTFTHPDDSEKGANLTQQFKNGEIDSFQIEKRYVTHSSKIFHALVSISTVHKSKDEFIAMTQIQDISDKLRIEKELTASNERYERAVRGSEIGLWEWNTESDEIYWSPKVKDITGYGEFDKLFLLDNLNDLVHPDDKEYRKASFKNHLESGEAFNIEYRLKHKKGHYIWLHSRAESIRNKQGKVTKMYGSVEDISRKKEAELKLEEVNERYQLVLDATRDGIWDWPNTNEIDQYWSPTMYRLVGYEDREIDSNVENFYKLLHPDDVEICRVTTDKHMESNEPFDIEYRLKTKSGEYKWFQARALITVKDGISRMTGSATDINRRKKAEATLKESEKRFSLVVEGSRDGIWDWPNTDNDEQYWSVGWKKLLGYEDNEIEAKASAFFEMIHPDDRHIPSEYMKDRMKDCETFDLEYRLKNKDGNYKWYQGKGIVTVRNGITRMTGSLTDINAKKEAEDKIKDYNKELEIINEDLDSFAYITSHDLKEPLRGISNNVLFLSQDYTSKIDKKGMKKFDRIISLCEKMGKLIDDILEYSKLKNKELVIKEVDLNRVIEDIEITLENKILENNVEIIIPKKLPITICDQVTITEALRNLISNAIKYNKSNKKIIEIGFKEENTDCIFYVKDNGIGVEKKFFDIIFAPFKRLDNIDQIIEGSGVGLHFVQRIIQRHGGKIWVESDLGKGATFYFTLGNNQLSNRDNNKNQKLSLNLSIA